MKNNELVNKAINIMKEAHKNQKDKSGEIYERHPMYVAMKADEKYHDDIYVIIALLHDTIEDSDYVTPEYLKHEGFDDAVINALVLLTHQKNIPYMDYVNKIKDNTYARRIKMIDLSHNMDLTRLNYELTDNDLKRIKKYHHAYLLLQQYENNYINNTNE